MNTFERDRIRRNTVVVTAACTMGLLSCPLPVSGQTLSLSAAAIREAAKSIVTPWIHGEAGDDSLRGSDRRELIHGYAGNDVLRGNGGDDFLFGGPGDDLLLGGTGDDDLSGGDGSDRLVGGSGNDSLEGGSGDDLLEGGAGDDRYLFREDFGRDVVRERALRHGGNDVIEFTGLMSTDATFLRIGDDLFIVDRETGQRVMVRGHFGAAGRSVELVRFADGEELVLDGFDPSTEFTLDVSAARD